MGEGLGFDAVVQVPQVRRGGRDDSEHHFVVSSVAITRPFAESTPW
jgi:hypothetical protein